MRHLETFGDRKGCDGVMLISLRSQPVHHSSCMRNLLRDGGTPAGVGFPFRHQSDRAGVQEPERTG